MKGTPVSAVGSSETRNRCALVFTPAPSTRAFSRGLLSGIVAVLTVMSSSCYRETVGPDQMNIPQETLSSVFFRSVELPKKIHKLDAWRPRFRGRRTSLEALPSYSRPLITKGQFVLYEVEHFDGAVDYSRRDHYVVLEYVDQESPSVAAGNPIALCLRIYGETDDGDGLVLNRSFSGHLTDSSWSSLERDYRWAAPVLELKEGSIIALDELSFFIEYLGANFKKQRNISSWVASWASKGRSKSLGELYEFNYSYDLVFPPQAGSGVLVCAEGIPIRGLVYAQQVWSSSSGVRGGHTTITLLNYGILSERLVSLLKESDNLLPEEVAFFKELGFQLQDAALSSKPILPEKPVADEPEP